MEGNFQSIAKLQAKFLNGARCLLTSKRIQALCGPTSLSWMQIYASLLIDGWKGIGRLDTDAMCLGGGLFLDVFG